MADIAFEYNDEALKKACSALFDDIYNKKMYLTGGIGQSAVGEAFTVPYDLPNSRAYTETCAAIALVYFASRMQKMKVDSRLGDVIERAIFNGILSGVSLDGSAFFYKNPLEFLHAERGRNVGVPNQQEPFPEAVRQRVFGCSCCPPNITRFIASIGDYICGEDENTVYIHQYISSAVKTSKGDITIKTDYPYGAEIDISTDGSFSGKLALRIPSYSKYNYEIKLKKGGDKPQDDGDYDAFYIVFNGGKYDNEKEELPVVIENGYAYIDIDGASTVNLVLDTMPKAVYANPLVNEDAGRVAVTMGPLVYCAESVDNGENLRALKISENSVKWHHYKDNDELGTMDIVIKGRRLTQNSFDGGLYAYEREYEPCEIRLIPFYACINRGECDMTVWLPSE
jgi:DUF1680 family protein